MSTQTDITHGFGVPNSAMPHQFLVRISQGRADPVEVWEDFGAAAAATSAQTLCRVSVPRETWRQVAEGLKVHLNRRLKEKGIKGSRFATGDNRVERILGREITVLAWAIEDATPDDPACPDPGGGWGREKTQAAKACDGSENPGPFQQSLTFQGMPE